MASANPFALSAGAEIGGFQLVRVLGAGGFGITYEAISPTTRRRWAIKEFFPQGFASRENATRVVYSTSEGDIIQRALDQFERSTQKLCELEHPSIVKVFHYIKDNGTGYMVMDYVEGPTFEMWLKDRSETPSLAELRPILEKVFDALEYAHSCNTVHRDIAPDNIVLRKGEHPVLIDFGALKVINPNTSARLSSLIVRKRFYSPPEQSDIGLDTRPAQDVYALAAVLYRAIAGVPPADSEDRKNAIAFDRPDCYVPLGPRDDLPTSGATRRAIDRALSFRSAERPQTMRAFRESLDWGTPGTRPVGTEAIPKALRAAPDKVAGSERRRTGAIALGSAAAALLVVVAAFILTPRGAGPTQSTPKVTAVANPCSNELLEAATTVGEDGLNRFLSTCSSGTQADLARLRLNTRIDARESMLARDAGFDAEKLHVYLKNCTRCSDRTEVNARLALIKEEETIYRAAAGSIDRLEAYARQCKACLHRDEALRGAGALRQTETARSKADDAAYQAVKGSIERLENYAKTCDLCRHRETALREANALRQADRVRAARAKADEDAYGAARGSIDRLESYAKTCDVCRYREQALREAKELRQAAAPARPPTMPSTQPVPSLPQTRPTTPSITANEIPKGATNLIYSPWTKFCLTGKEANAKQVCFTGKDGRIETGVPVVAAVLIEPENEPRKILRVTLPLGMSLQPGTRVIVDQDQPMTGRYVICFNNGCMADYEASTSLIDRLRRGRTLMVQGINGAGQAISLTLPLSDFARAYNGPPTDPKVFEAQQKKLQEELQRRAKAAQGGR